MTTSEGSLQTMDAHGQRRDCRVSGGTIPIWTSGSEPHHVLCVHGWTLDHTVWVPQHRGLAQIATVTSFDRRGFGQASAPANIVLEPLDVLALLDGLKMDRAWLIGQSQGARVAAAFALQFPERVAGLILQGAPAGSASDGGRANDIPLERFRDLTALGDLARMRSEWLAHPLMHSSDPTAAAALARILSTYDGSDLLVPSSELVVNWDRIGELPFHVAFVVGERESKCRIAFAQEQVVGLPNASLAVIADSGHLCNFESPQAFNHCVAALVGKELPDAQG